MNNERFTFLKSVRAMALTLFALCAMGLSTADAACSCSNDANITIRKNADGMCEKELVPADLAISACADAATIEAVLIEPAEHWKGSSTSILPAAGSIVVTVPGRYEYKIKDANGVQLCWGTFNAEDKSGPVCANADGMGDVADNDLNDKTQIVSCSVVDAYAKFDILEEDDFMDCTGIKEGSVVSETLKESGCALDFQTELALLIPDAAIAAEIEDPTAAIAALPAPATGGAWEICDIIVRSWSAQDWNGNTSPASAACTQVVVVIRPTALTFTMVDTLQCDRTDIATRNSGSPLSYTDLRSTADGVGDAAGVLDICAQPITDTDAMLEVSVSEDGSHACKWSVFPGDPQVQYTCTDHEDGDGCSSNTTTGKIIQSYTWVDWCTGAKETMTALTVVEDTIAPTIVVGGAPTLWDNAFDCDVEVRLPSITATDNCSEGTIDYVFEVTGAGSHTGGSFDRYTKADVDGGEKIIVQNGDIWVLNIRSWDCCGTESTLSLTDTIEVIDTRAPTCIANDKLNVSVIKTDPHGSTNDHRLGARVKAEDLDDTSHDNCSSVTLEVRDPNAAAGTANAAFGEFVEYDWTTAQFETASNGTCSVKVWLELRVTDEAGNSSICNTEVEFTDENPPVVGPHCVDEGTTSTFKFGKVSNVSSITCVDKETPFSSVSVWGACVTSTPTPGSYVFPHCAGSVRICDVLYTNVIEVKWLTTAVSKTGEHSTFEDEITEVLIITEAFEEKFTFPVDHKVSCDADGGLNIPDELSLNEILDASGCSPWTMSVTSTRFSGGDEDACYTIRRVYEFWNQCRAGNNGVSAGEITRGCASPVMASWSSELAATGGLMAQINAASGAARTAQCQAAEYVAADENYIWAVDADGDAITGMQDLSNRNLLSAGRFTYTQLIKVFDHTAPTATITNEQGCDVDTDGCAQGTAKFTVTATDGCSPNPTIGAWYINTVGNQAGFTQSGNMFIGSGLETGAYELHVQVSDECGNDVWATSTVTVTQSDCKKPTPIGHLPFTALMENCTVDIWLSDVLRSFSDNCEGPYAFGIETTADFVEGDMPTDTVVTIETAGGSEIVLWMADAAGNTQYTTVPVVAQDNAGDCGAGTDPGAAAQVAGDITNEGDEMVDGVTIDVNGNGISPVIALINGQFNLSIPMTQDVTVTPTKTTGPVLNGVSTGDLVLLTRHLLGSQELTSPYKLIAADVNADTKLNGRDMLAISRLILGITNDFGDVPSWRFVDKAHTFVNPTSPWGFPESVNYVSLDADAQANFIGVKMGDISGNANPNRLLGDDNTTVGAMTIAIDDATIAAGSTHDIAFTAKDFNDFTGYQFSIELAEGVEFQNVTVGALPNHTENNFALSGLDNGVITTNWANADALDLEDGAVLFTISVSAASDMNVSEAISISSAVTAAEAYNNDLDAYTINTQFNRATSNFALFQNTPNPFSSETVIGFELPTEGAVSLKVMDVAGRVLTQRVGTYTAGTHQITLNKSELGATGVLYYQLDTDAHSATKKMVILE